MADQGKDEVMGREELYARMLMTSFDRDDRVIVTRDGVEFCGAVVERIYSIHSGLPLTLTGDNGAPFEVTTEDLATERVRVRLEPLFVEKQDRPMPGDAVRMATPWRWAGSLVKPDALGVIGGMVGQYPEDGHASITFNASTHRTENVVSCSGGPATIATDLGTLTPTDDRVTLSVWRSRGSLLGRDGSKSYTVDVPVWDWHPED
jgi:hypothetical protein